MDEITENNYHEFGSYSHRTWAEIDIDKIEKNIDIIKSLLPEGCGIIGVVKADAYGHGAVMISKTLEKVVTYFAVSSLHEGIQLRKCGITKDILILGYTPAESANLLIENNITQTIFSYNYAKALYNKISAGKLLTHIKLDTGMTRLGYEPFEKEDIIKTVADFSLKIDFIGIFTHFAVSDDITSDFTDKQFSYFIKTTEYLSSKGVQFKYRHVCNSAAIINYPRMHLDLVRPGIILYGLYPDKSTKKIGLEPALSFKTVIAQTHKIKKGTTISYGRTFNAENDMTVATIPVGYADGFSRLFSNTGTVLINGKRAKIVGRVCMDQSIIDVSGIDDVKTGTIVTLIGRDGNDEITLEEIADRMDTINYEATCLIGKRVPRIYLKNRAPIATECLILE